MTLRAKLLPADRWVRGRLFDPYAEQSLREHYDGSPQATQFLAQRLRVSRLQIHEWAHRLGLTRQVQGRNSWRPDEIAYLEAHWGTMSARYIGKHLHRRPSTVTVKARKLRLRLIGNGWTQTQVAEGFGVSRSTVERWQARGWLHAEHINDGHTYNISQESLLTFVRGYPLAFDVRRVDQLWFIGLVLGLDARTLAPVNTKTHAANYRQTLQTRTVALTEDDLRY
jgi:hypothetical protein